MWIDGADQQKAAQYRSCTEVQIQILYLNFKRKKMGGGVFTFYTVSQYFWKLGCSLLAVLTESATVQRFLCTIFFLFPGWMEIKWRVEVQLT